MDQHSTAEKVSLVTVYCGKIAVRVWTTAGGMAVPLCIEHAKAHPFAQPCYAGEVG